MGATASTSHKGKTEQVPMWIYTAKVPDDTSGDKFAAVSPGFQFLGPNTVQRTRKGTFDTDGARWNKGFSSGKHVFEVVYPVSQRGINATVGVAQEATPLHVKGKVSLVGYDKTSWGIDLRSRRSFHNNSPKRYPQTQVYLPDKFYMYLDADSGMLLFGSDIDFYGTAHGGIDTSQPLYPMVGATQEGVGITIVYRGQGDPTRIMNVFATPAGPPLEQPPPRQAPPPYSDNNQPAPPAPMGREGTSVSKMAEAGPPPPPPTKMSHQPGGEAAGSQVSLKEEKKELDKAVEVIPEETRETDSKKE